MKVYWENFGIHVEAEDDGENEALGLIWNRLRSVRIEEKSISWKSRNKDTVMDRQLDLNIGEIVHLKSGSPDLKVIRTQDLVEVEWLNEEGGKEQAVFPRTSLQYPKNSN